MGIPASAEIEKEAEYHIALGLLLRKDRDEKKKNAVQKVLASGLATPQKIDRIREIDEKDDALALLSVVRQVNAQTHRGRVGRVSRVIKRSIRRPSYVVFLFRDLRRIREFGRKTHVFETRLLPPGVRMDPRLKTLLIKEIQPAAMDLSRRLVAVVEHGWLYLTPRQYNLLVLLKRLSDRLGAFDFLRLSWRDPYLIDKLRRIEGLFLMLHYQPETVEALLAAVRSFMEKQHEAEEEIVQTSGLVLEILSEEFALPSLYNVIVGLNIMKYRCMVTLGDLLREGLDEIVDTERFDCDATIRARMESYIEESLQSIKKVHEQLTDARRINSFTSLDNQGRLDVTILRSMYMTAGFREQVDFEGDRENVVVFMSRLIRAFDATFAPLLSGRCRLEGGKQAELFLRSFFELDFTKVRTIVEKLEKGPFHFVDFPLSRYIQIKGARLGTVGSELEATQLIIEGVGCLVDLGRTLAKVLSARTSATSDEPSAPLQPVVLQGKAFSLPFENARLGTAPFIGGRSVIEGLSLCVSVCFTLGLLFQDDFLSLFVGKDRKLAVELQTRLKLMENLLDPNDFNDLSALYL